MPGVIELPDGRTVRGSSRRAARNLMGDADLVVYLQVRAPRKTATDFEWIRWPDFRLPRSTTEVVSRLREAHRRAATERVLVVCSGGTGRTGTALALIAVLGGVEAANAVEWIRENYRPRAVETRRQREWITDIGTQLGG
ncbi:protein-tyrosine phosphatase family protein [Glutamicibacter sp. MNS18]|uniref:protein-tyrosine phosphatase family protein n=1 Tax=Glutamicibacter sp. MNS18 TaxID=2989817 RepID=UPI0022360506|nr:protein-tyrosine phosphatase family protein [Glutamicibacter sp. MNS18]MCW4464692.1 protein-tyrosine phosphatase family protein [Glutamicibacter sp. MNS18]